MTRLLLRVVYDAGFALAGSGAIREHGVSARPTEDVDLFTTNVDAQRFDQAIDQAVATLHEHGYRVLEHRRAEQYVRLNVTAPDGHQLEVDFGIDWRAHEPVRLDVGPVLALPDAVANKVGALYGRAEVRDYLDVDAIRQSGHYTDEQLLDLATEHDPGFERPMFASLLARVRDLTEGEVIEYGVNPDQLAQVKQRLGDWSTQLRVADQRQDDGPAVSTGREVGREVRPSGPESAASSRKREGGRPARLSGVRDDRPPAPGENRARGYRR